MVRKYSIISVIVSALLLLGCVTIVLLKVYFRCYYRFYGHTSVYMRGFWLDY